MPTHDTAVDRAGGGMSGWGWRRAGSGDGAALTPLRRVLNDPDVDARTRTLRAQAPAAFEFLVTDHGFSPPEPVEHGLRYTRQGLSIEITAWTWNHETGFSTRLHIPLPNGRRSSTGLDDLYVHLGHGPAQHVGSSATTNHTVAKRIREHAAALIIVLADPGFEEAIRESGS